MKQGLVNQSVKYRLLGVHRYLHDEFIAWSHNLLRDKYTDLSRVKTLNILWYRTSYQSDRVVLLFGPSMKSNAAGWKIVSSLGPAVVSLFVQSIG